MWGVQNIRKNRLQVDKTLKTFVSAWKEISDIQFNQNCQCKDDN